MSDNLALRFLSLLNRPCEMRSSRIKAKEPEEQRLTKKHREELSDQTESLLLSPPNCDMNIFHQMLK